TISPWATKISAGRSAWLCHGTTPPGAIVSLRKRNSWSLSITCSLPRSIEPKVGVGDARRRRVDLWADIGLHFACRAFTSERVSGGHCSGNEKAGEEYAVAGRPAEWDTYGHDLILPCHALAGGTAASAVQRASPHDCSYGNANSLSY